MLVLCLGGEVDTGFVLPGLFSDDNPASSASADALHWSFPDGAVIEYEPENGALTATGIQTATIEAAVKILFDSSEVKCTTLLKTAQPEVTKGGTMKGDVTLIIKICLLTGCRWSEAANFKASQVSSNKITFIHTKGKKNRSVPINNALYNELKDKEDRFFAECYRQFYRVIRLAGIELPEGQMSHVLRHSFANHLMMAGGNIIVLQRIFRHSDIRVTMRYAHFAPDNFEDEIRCNPLTLLAKESGDSESSRVEQKVTASQSPAE